jgi:PadR family transcriptional regulator, regulatory protein PadR
VNTNTIYPLLRRLEERGFIVGEWEHPTKRSRRYYRVTDAGHARLDRIKDHMLPYLDTLAGSIARLRSELYNIDAA